jgi:hypothetical protein
MTDCISSLKTLLNTSKDDLYFVAYLVGIGGVMPALFESQPAAGVGWGRGSRRPPQLVDQSNQLRELSILI